MVGCARIGIEPPGAGVLGADIDRRGKRHQRNTEPVCVVSVVKQGGGQFPGGRPEGRDLRARHRAGIVEDHDEFEILPRAQHLALPGDLQRVDAHQAQEGCVDDGLARHADCVGDIIEGDLDIADPADHPGRVVGAQKIGGQLPRRTLGQMRRRPDRQRGGIQRFGQARPGRHGLMEIDSRTGKQRQRDEHQRENHRDIAAAVLQDQRKQSPQHCPSAST